MPLEHIFQIRFVEVRLLQQLLDACLVFGAPHGSSNRRDVLCPEHFRGDAFEIYFLSFAHSLLRQSARGKKLHGKSAVP